MRVAMYYNNHDVRLEELPAPAIGPGELLLRLHASGICGSDVMEWYRLDKAPLVLGHEVAGEVVAVGDGVVAYHVGDRVVASHHVPCNRCRACLAGHHTVCELLRTTYFDPGGLAEYVRLPAPNVERGIFLLPPELSYEEGSMMEPLACVVRGQRQARLKPGQCVLVLGSGLAGLLHIQLARALGAGPIVAVDIVEFRRQAAHRLGADAVLDAGEPIPERLRTLNGGRLADLVILSTGAEPAIRQALQCVELGGTVLFFAPAAPEAKLPVPLNDLFWRNELTLTSTYAAAPADFVTALALARTGRVQLREMVTHRLGLAEAGLGFRLTAEAQDSLKVIIEPQR